MAKIKKEAKSANESSKRRFAKAEFETPWEEHERAAVHNHYYNIKSTKPFNFGKLSFGLMVVLVGLLYLGVNMGFLPQSVWPDVAKLWPVFIIIFGLSLISGNGLASFLVGSIITMTVLALVVILTFSNIKPADNNDLSLFYNQSESGKTVTGLSPFFLELNPNADDLTVNIALPFGQLDLSGGSTAAAEGELDSNTCRLTFDSVNQDKNQTVNLLAEQAIDNNQGVNNLTVRLNDSVKTLNISGSSNANLNLTGLMTETVNLTGKESSLTLDNRQNRPTATINAAADKLALTVAEDVSLKINDSAADPGNLPEIKQTTADNPDYIINLDSSITEVKLNQ